MDFGCCADDEGVVANESGEQFQPLVSSSESQDSFDDQANTLHRDYSEVTPLFRAIELEDWKGILLFLTSGRWSNSPLASSYTHMQDTSPQRQTRTWISYRGKKNELQWRQLPLHAAISYSAPLPVVQKLLELYHDAIRSTDDTGNLPLHLAFGFGSPDNVLAYLITEYPQALAAKGLQNRRPLNCCDLGPNKARGDIIQACQDYTRSCLMKNWDKHWKKSLADARKRSGMFEPMASKCNTIEEVFDELMQVKMELKKTKELARNRPTMIITKTEPAPLPPPVPIKRVPSTASARLFSRGKRSGSKIKAGLMRGLKTSGSSSVAPEI